MPIHLTIDPATDGPPLYLRIAEGIRQELARGRLREGERLPPIRELAGRLGVNRDTVALAYEALASDGVVRARVGSGTFVRARRPNGGVGQAPFAPPCSALVERLLAFERARPRFGVGQDAVPLHALIPDPALFPVQSFRRAMNRALADGGASLLGYAGPQGHAGLREVLAERLRSFGILARPEELVLSHGASQGITLALRLFADPGDTVAVEEPTYHNVLGALVGLGLEAAPVPMTGEGVDLAALDRTLSRPEVKLLYTIPTFHNPMGITTDLAHRRALLALAVRHGKPVVEDAYEMDLRFQGRPVPALAALDTAGAVIHLFSFSKSLFPGGRVGSVLARGRGVEGLLALKNATDLGGALPIQAALADFVRSGAYDRHLVRLRKVLRGRRDALLEALAESMPQGVSWTTPEGGYQVWVELPESIDTRDLLADALRAGVLFAPGHQFQHDARRSRGLRLSIALAEPEAIRRGVTALARVVRERLRDGGDAAREAPVPL
jgi:DNA-binding transcriptional MocR family regulator